MTSALHSLFLCTTALRRSRGEKPRKDVPLMERRWCVFGVLAVVLLRLAKPLPLWLAAVEEHVGSHRRHQCVLRRCPCCPCCRSLGHRSSHGLPCPRLPRVLVGTCASGLVFLSSRVQERIFSYFFFILRLGLVIGTRCWFQKPGGRS